MLIHLLFMSIVPLIALWMLIAKVIDFAEFIGMSIMGASLSLLISMIPVIIIDHCIAKELHLVNTLELVSAKAAATTHGNFFIFGGTIKEEPYYFYYYKEGEFIKQNYERTSHCMIKEETRKDGELQIYESIYKDKRWNKWINISFASEISNTYVFVVPKGSVVRSFNFN